MNPITPNVETNVPPRVASRGRRILRRIWRGLKWLGIGIVTILIVALVFQAASVEFDKHGYRPPGQMVNVDGHMLHIYCTGTGSPTVILEAGAYSYSTEWYWVQRQLSTTNRVCSYDRAGNGWSEPVSGARDGLPLVQELHTLLHNASIPGPYALAGHSLGGILNRIYAIQYPDEVVGIVTVDSAVPQTWPDISGYEKYKAQNESAYWLLSVLARFGVARFIIGREFASYGFPSAVSAELTALKSNNQAVDTWDAEVRLAQWNLAQQSKAAENLGSLPVVVLWAGHPEMSAEDHVLLKAIHDSVLAFSTNTVVRVIDGADHGSIQGNEQYATQISAAIREVIESAHTGQPLASK
jgi:pimeloyl-ACP methyl ester carboxylesterase